MAHTKAAGATKLGRESKSKRLGVKLFGGESAKPGDIIVRQRGTRYTAGKNTQTGVDHTIYAVAEGKISFQKKAKRSFANKRQEQVLVHVTQ